MILLPIIAFAVYAAFNSKRTVKGAATRKVTTESADATTRLILMIIVGVVLLALATGGASY
jgi:hypothetical protein